MEIIKEAENEEPGLNFYMFLFEVKRYKFLPRLQDSLLDSIKGSLLPNVDICRFQFAIIKTMKQVQSRNYNSLFMIR